MSIFVHSIDKGLPRKGNKSNKPSIIVSMPPTCSGLRQMCKNGSRLALLAKRDNNKSFHPNPVIAAGKIPEPLFFSENLRSKILFFNYANELAAIGELSGQTMHKYTSNVPVSKALEAQNDAQNPQDEKPPKIKRE